MNPTTGTPAAAASPGVRLDPGQALELRTAMRDIHAALQHALDLRLAHRGVTASQCLVLDAFRRRPQAGLADVCASLSLDAAALARLLSRLEDQGLCLRYRPRGDRRNVRVELLAPGIALADEFPPLVDDVTDLVLAGFDERERAIVVDGLRRLLHGGARVA